jgi:peptide/nickel transport system substrate-binding protein
MDWATVGSRRATTDTWDVFVTGFPTFYHPATDIYLDSKWPGFWESEERDRLLADFVSAVDLERQQELWSQIQQVFWDEVPIYLLGDYFNLSGQRSDVRGYANLPDKFFWNVWLDR